MASGRVIVPVRILRSLLRLPRDTTITNIAILTGPPRLEITVAHPDIVDPTSAVPILRPEMTPGSFVDWGQQ
jgi:hypothetical protein